MVLKRIESLLDRWEAEDDGLADLDVDAGDAIIAAG